MRSQDLPYHEEHEGHEGTSRPLRLCGEDRRNRFLDGMDRIGRIEKPDSRE